MDLLWWLERKCAGANYVQILGPMCGAEEVTHSQRRAVPVPQYVPVSELTPFEMYRVLSKYGYADQNLQLSVQSSHQAVWYHEPRGCDVIGRLRKKLQ